LGAEARCLFSPWRQRIAGDCRHFWNSLRTKEVAPGWFRRVHSLVVPLHQSYEAGPITPSPTPQGSLAPRGAEFRPSMLNLRHRDAWSITSSLRKRPVESTNQVQKISQVRVYPGANADFTLYSTTGRPYA